MSLITRQRFPLGAKVSASYWHGSLIKSPDEENLQKSIPCLLKNAILLSHSHLIYSFAGFCCTLSPEISGGRSIYNDLERQIFDNVWEGVIIIFTQNVESSEQYQSAVINNQSFGCLQTKKSLMLVSRLWSLYIGILPPQPQQ